MCLKDDVEEYGLQLNLRRPKFIWMDGGFLLFSLYVYTPTVLNRFLGQTPATVGFSLLPSWDDAFC